jgi:predicted dinucleotide-binding enzyme
MGFIDATAGGDIQDGADDERRHQVGIALTGTEPPGNERPAGPLERFAASGGEEMVQSTSATDRIETIGIIGAGRAGQALARTALRAGRQVVIANSRGPDSLASVVTALGAGVTAGKVAEAAGCPIVALAVPWDSIPGAAEGLSWSGQIVIDATNALLFPDLQPAPLGGRTSSEIVAELVPGARLVKAGNTLAADVLGADPSDEGGSRVIFVSGDDAPANDAVVELFAAAGFFAIDLGDLVTGGRMQQVGGPLAGHNLVRLPPVG